MAKAKYYLMSCDFIDGEEADRVGLVSKSVPRAELEGEAMSVATTSPPAAVAIRGRSGH